MSPNAPDQPQVELQNQKVPDIVVLPPQQAHFPVEDRQPMAAAPMDPQRPHPDDAQLGLRGGDRGGCCPGRFCFCVPCPLPCDFCII